MISALRKGLKVGSFCFSLSKRFPSRLTEILTHVDKYINAKKEIVEKQRKKEEQKWVQEDNPSPQPKK